MSFPRNFKPLAPLLCGVGALLIALRTLATPESEITDTPSVVGLREKVISTNTVLTWPSDPRESFVVLWRSNANYQTRWTFLANPWRATPTSHETTFLDSGGLTRIPEGTTNLTGLYAVHVIPDFWFDMRGVTLCGGPKMPDGDFLPFYYGIRGPGFPQPSVGLLVDGEDAGWGPIHLERVNFGTSQSPRWVEVAGFWLGLDLVPDGEHTLQLSATLPLNNFVGDWTQDIILTNKPVRIRVSPRGYPTNGLTWWDQRLGRDFRACGTLPEYAKTFPRQENESLEASIPPRPLFLATEHKSAFRLQLGLDKEFIQVTPAYSNAVLTALLPCFSDFAQKLDLPIPHSITRDDVADFRILPWRRTDGQIAGGTLATKQGFALSFENGHVSGFARTRGLRRTAERTDQIPKKPADTNMTSGQAIRLARDTITRLGIPLQAVFAEQEPRVLPPRDNATSTAAHYRIEWRDPRGNGPGPVQMEINAQTRQIQNLLLRGRNLQAPSPTVSIVPPTGHGMFDSQLPTDRPNPEYARELIPIMLKAIEQYADKLSLPIPHPLTTNHVARVELYDNGGWPHCEIELTNNWRLVYRHAMVSGYYGPDNFFASDNRPIRIKEFEGNWRLTTNQAIAVVRQAVAKLNYPTNNVHMDFPPVISTASVDQQHIPRLHFEWLYNLDESLQSRLEAEVNAETGRLESLYYDDKAYWSSRPPINLPISLPPAQGTSQPSGSRQERQPQ